MIGISYSRSVYASIIGLVVQLLAAFAVFTVSLYVRGDQQPHSYALYNLAWLLAGGIPIWFGMLLVFDQKRRASNESEDLEQLRRERAASGASTAIFEDEGRSLRIAGTRLEWMQRFLLPTISLVTGLALSLGGVYLLYHMQAVLNAHGVDPSGLKHWRALDQWWLLDPEHTVVKSALVAIIALAITLLATFLFSRYASGMGRVKEWQLLRAGGSYMLGSTLAIVLVTIGLGLYVYSNGSSRSMDYYMAWIIPAVMVLLGVEMLLNFVLDLYRPRTPGVEPRAAFDSRFLGLFAEPGGIAHSIAEAINYQFGFEVSKTWFYQLVMRSAVPLAGLGALTLWAMTTIVIVDPNEHAIVERWGRQLNPEQPLKSGWHFKAPWPWDVVRKYNTGNVNRMYVGFDIYDARPKWKSAKDETGILLWTQDDHFGEKHWEFMIPRPEERDSMVSAQDRDTQSQDSMALTLVDDSSNREAAPVNLVRMIFEVQYRISAENLATYTQESGVADRVLLNEAWREATRFAATEDIHTLLSRNADNEKTVAEFTAGVRQRLSERAKKLGLDIVYVGLQNVHPEKTVSDAFRDVVNAEAEKISKIREARGDENRILSDIAGRPDRARRLATAIEEAGRYTSDVEHFSEALQDVDAATWDAFKSDLEQHSPAFETTFRAVYEARLHKERYERADRDFNLGIGSSQGDVMAAREALTAAENAAEEAETRLTAVLNDMAHNYPAGIRADLIAWGRAKMAAKFWDDRLKEQLIGLQGEAAVTLSQARAKRWEEELTAAAEVARLRIEREAFRRAPNVYRARLLFNALAEEYAKTRKYVLAFDPEERNVHIRYQAEEQARPGGTLSDAVREGQK